MALCPSTVHFWVENSRLGEANAPHTSGKPRRVGDKAPGGAAWHLSGSF
jgi:hypothetical protein